MRSQKKQKFQLLSRLNRILDFPISASGASTIEITESGRMKISRCYAIAEYSPSTVVLTLKHKTVSIQGDCLILQAYANGSVEIHGKVSALHLVSKGGN